MIRNCRIVLDAHNRTMCYVGGRKASSCLSHSQSFRGLECVAAYVQVLIMYLGTMGDALKLEESFPNDQRVRRAFRTPAQKKSMSSPGLCPQPLALHKATNAVRAPHETAPEHFQHLDLGSRVYVLKGEAQRPKWLGSRVFEGTLLGFKGHHQYLVLFPNQSFTWRTYVIFKEELHTPAIRHDPIDQDVPDEAPEPGERCEGSDYLCAHRDSASCGGTDIRR